MNKPHFLRRTTWLYPDDGCYMRATHAAQSFERAQKIRPGKVFAFGNLKYKTIYSKRGAVYWWYHVAAAFRIGDQAIVIDPAVELAHPLSLEEWMKRIAPKVGKSKVAVCDTYAYTPRSSCVGGSQKQEAGFQKAQKSFSSQRMESSGQLKNETRYFIG